jgi:parvulin-like peptidyl-prolyl isomerase
MVRFDRFPSKADARNAIIAMGNRVVFGAPLDAVAKRESQGSMAANGGQHEWTPQGSMENKQLEQQLFDLRIQYLSDIIESAEGFHIVRVQEREAQVTRPFVEIQTEIKDQILTNDRKAKVDEFLEMLKAEIPVWTIFDDEAEVKSARDSLTLPIR